MTLTSRMALIAAVAVSGLLPGCSQREVTTTRVCAAQQGEPITIREIRFYQVETFGQIGFFPKKPRPAAAVVLVGQDGRVLYMNQTLGLSVGGQKGPLVLDVTSRQREETLWWPDSLGWFIPNEKGRSNLFPKRVAPWPASGMER